MVKLNKTPLPAGIAIASANDYRSGEAFRLIAEDCHNKCYICEEKGITGINVEHRVAHEGNPELKYCWENLFLSCTHCNKAKLNHYNDILDCTKVDPEEYISLSMLPYPKENVSVELVQETTGASQTVSLLDRVYNGTSTTIMALESENLKSRIFDELVSFQHKLHKYFTSPNSNRKGDYKIAILDMIDRGSAFAAFKRKIVRDNPTYMKEFGAYLA